MGEKYNFNMAAETLSKCRTILQVIYEHTLYICMKTSMIIYVRDVLRIKIRLLMLDFKNKLIPMANYKMAAMKSMNTPKMLY